MSLVGNVKWFSSKKGFGFITVVTPDSEHTGTDIFVHFSDINTRENNYKRLFPGEYVSFSLGRNKKDQSICIDVMGVMGGPLLSDHTEHRYKIFPKVNRIDNNNDNNDNNNDNNDDNNDVNNDNNDVNNDNNDVNNDDNNNETN